MRTCHPVILIKQKFDFDLDVLDQLTNYRNFALGL